MVVGCHQWVAGSQRGSSVAGKARKAGSGEREAVCISQEGKGMLEEAECQSKEAAILLGRAKEEQPRHQGRHRGRLKGQDHYGCLRRGQLLSRTPVPG